MLKLRPAAVALALLATAAAQAAPVTYTVDPTHTFARFSYNHLGLSTQHLRFDSTTGTVVFDKEAKTGSVDVTIDAKSIATGSKVFDEHIQAPDFFDTAQFPTATFKSTAVKFEGDKPATIEGNLTIKGVTKPVTLKVTSFTNIAHPMLKKDAIGADATTVVKRSDFNAGKYAPAVQDEVTITVSLEAVAK